MNNIDVKFGGYHKEFAILTPKNYEKLPAYMQEKGIKKLQIKDDSYGWNRDYMPSLKPFDFIDELFVFFQEFNESFPGVSGLPPTLWFSATSIAFLTFQLPLVYIPLKRYFCGLSPLPLYSLPQ